MRLQTFLWLAIAPLYLWSPESSMGQAQEGAKGGSNNNTQRYLEMRKRLPTVEVNGTLVTHGAVEDRMRSMRRMDFFSTYKEYEDTKPAAFRAMARDQIIDEEIALQEAEKRGIGLAQGEAEKVADQFLPNDPNKAKIKMDEHGILDQRALLNRSARNTIIDKLMVQVTADFPEPTSEELRTFYEKNSRVFEVTPEMVLARRIFIVLPQGTKIRTLEYAELVERGDRLIDRLKNGEDFAELADRNTEDPNGIGVGGSMGWIKRGDMPTEMEKVLFSQKVGAIPDKSFRTAGGFNILLIEDKKPPVLQPFEEAIPRIQRGIRIERFKEWLAEKRRNAEIVYYEELPMKYVLEGRYPRKTDIPY